MEDFLQTVLIHLGDYYFRVINLLIVIFILVFTYTLLYVLRRIIERPRRKEDQTEIRRRHSIFLLVKYVVWVVAIISMIEAAGFKVQFLLAGSAALLVGIGLGLQSIFSDFVGGIFLLVEGTIKVGEVIEVDGLVGRVQEIHLRNTQVISRDNVVFIVPNSKFVTEKVVNWSIENEIVRFMVNVRVAHGTDAFKARDVLLNTMKSIEGIEQFPEPFVRFKDFGESSLDFELVFWSKESFRIDNIKSELRYEIYGQLSNNGITIPFPQRDLHIIHEKKSTE